MLCVFLAILCLNLLTPMMSDDYYYAGAESIGQAIRLEAEQYNTWVGRSVAHLIVRLFLMLPRAVFQVCNALAFIALTLLIYRLADPERGANVPLYLFIVAALWLFLPDFGQTVLWQTGACNYLWITALILLFLLPYLRAVDGVRTLGGGVLPTIGLSCWGFWLGGGTRTPPAGASLPRCSAWPI